MTYTIPHIVKAAESLLLEVEKAVAAFPVKYRHGLGADLRGGATSMVLLGQEAARARKEPKRQRALLRELSRCIDRAKLQILMGHRLQCYSLGRCEALTLLAAACGQQCGGWLNSVEPRKQNPNGQNSAAPGQRERAKTLSTGAASREAY
ncbi:MAG TPA: four helix bundle protein [Nevskia sp.]|nr:four helix bundle protein [Nevskia sp.]